MSLHEKLAGLMADNYDDLLCPRTPILTPASDITIDEPMFDLVKPVLPSVSQGPCETGIKYKSRSVPIIVAKYINSDVFCVYESLADMADKIGIGRENLNLALLHRQPPFKITNKKSGNIIFITDMYKLPVYTNGIKTMDYKKIYIKAIMDIKPELTEDAAIQIFLKNYPRS
jgi:hypothetical protein